MAACGATVPHEVVVSCSSYGHGGGCSSSGFGVSALCTVKAVTSSLVGALQAVAACTATIVVAEPGASG